MAAQHRLEYGALEVPGLRNREDLGMILGLSEHLAEDDSAPAVGARPPRASTRNSGSRTWKEHEAVTAVPPGARQRMARRLISW